MDPYYSQFATTQGAYLQPESSDSVRPLWEQNQGVGRKNARWDTVEHNTFVTACETVIAEGHRQGKCFTKHGWERLIFLFNTTAKKNWTKQQLKNRWDSMRRDYNNLRALLRCTGVEYNTTTHRIVADEEWWVRKIKERDVYKDYKDRDCKELYVRYRVLFGDTYDGDQFAMTPTKLSRTGFGLFTQSPSEDNRDKNPKPVESSGSSDDPVTEKGTASMDISGKHSGDKRKSATKKGKEKRKKVSARELSFSVDRLWNAKEEVVAKTAALISPPGTDPTTCVKELLASGKLVKKTELYYFALTFLTHKRNREMFATIEDNDEKFDWVEYNFRKFQK